MKGYGRRGGLDEDLRLGRIVSPRRILQRIRFLEAELGKAEEIASRALYVGRDEKEKQARLEAEIARYREMLSDAYAEKVRERLKKAAERAGGADIGKLHNMLLEWNAAKPAHHFYVRRISQDFVDIGRYEEAQ
ncbi:MAG: hypothetical protein LBS24_04490 [Clostridiales Family XIII bacterium]|nr:hypothetical protein [Clostridiales Family XIII bacterium]